MSDPEAESRQLSQGHLQDYDMPSPGEQSNKDEESSDDDTVSDDNSNHISSTRGRCSRRGRGCGRSLGWRGRGRGVRYRGTKPPQKKVTCMSYLNWT